LANDRQGHILQPTALKNEAFVRLIKWQEVEWQKLAHFLGISATLITRILIKFSHEQKAAKRGGLAIQV